MIEISFSHRVLFFSLFILPGLILYIFKRQNFKQKILFFLIFFLFTCEVSMRVSGGTDYLSYQGLWDNVSSISKFSGLATSFEPGFVFYVFVLSRISDSIHFFQFVSFFIPCIIFVYLRAKLRLEPPILVLVFYSSFYAPYYLNGVGQGMAMALFLWIFFLLNYRQKNFNLGAAFVSVTSVLLHKSGVFSILLFLRSRKKKVGLVLGLFILAIVSSQIPKFLAYSPVKMAFDYNFTQELDLLDFIYRGLHIAIMLFFLKFVPDIPILRNAMFVYLVGFILFCALISFPTIALRTHMFFRVMEMIIYPLIAANLIKPGTRLIFSVSLLGVYLPQASINWLAKYNVVTF